MIAVRRYEAADKAAWNEFVGRAKNATFLFHRDYLEYHSDRFVDHSLLFFEDRRLVAALPANVNDGVLVSHGGLTYGGLLTDRRMTASLVLKVFDAFVGYAREQSLARIVYKAVPHIYHAVPAEEDLYALFRHGAKLFRRDVSSTIDLRERLPLTKGRKWGINQGPKNGVEVRESDDFATFMRIESEMLQAKYGTKPVHSTEEMALLASRFPQNIRLFGAFREGAMIAGTIIYETARVAHAQYIASTEAAREICAIDSVLAHLLDVEYAQKAYFDFGISTERQGTFLNTGLIDNKESWGGRATVYDFYSIDVGAADLKTEST